VGGLVESSGGKNTGKCGHSVNLKRPKGPRGGVSQKIDPIGLRVEKKYRNSAIWLTGCARGECIVGAPVRKDRRRTLISFSMDF